MSDLAVLSEIDPAARIAPDARIGPFCVIGPQVTIGPRTVLRRRITVMGKTTIGTGNDIEEGCVLGAQPQDLKYGGGPTLLVIGHRNKIGRSVTAHVGTEVGGYVTRIGDDNVLDSACHVGHDCFIDNHVYLGRHVQLAGHILIQTGAIVEEFAGLLQFTTIGRYSRVGSRTPVRRDVPPYTLFQGHDNDWSPAVRGIHENGIAAARLTTIEESELRRVLHELFVDEAALQTKIEHVMSMGVEGEAAALCEFCQQSLQGKYGRYREAFRGKVPPEAIEYLPPQASMPAGGS